MKKILAILSLAALTACASGEVRETLGLMRDAPDEFRVVSRPPLSVPPDFNLRAPEPGAAPRLEVNPGAEASRLFLKETNSVSDEPTTLLEESDVSTAIPSVIETTMPTSAESMLLGKLGADKVDPEIRSKLYSEEREAPKKKAVDAKNVTVLDQLLGYDKEEAVVDPFKEAERIRKNTDEGKPLNEGEVPVIDTTNENVIDKLF